MESSGALESDEVRVLNVFSAFLELLETTQMSKSFKMVVLLTMLDHDQFPGEMGIGELVPAVRRFVNLHPTLAEEFGTVLQSDSDLKSHLVRNPVAAWVGGAGTGGQSYFKYDSERFASLIAVPDNQRETFQVMARELAEWRLAEYLERPATHDGYVLKVSHSNGKPILFLPAREGSPGLPQDWVPITANGARYRANFVQVAVNVIRGEGSDDNQLPTLLRGWFGPSAGAPGTRHQVPIDCCF